MFYTYEQRSGAFRAPDGTLLGTGYSGHREGLNNPSLEAVPAVGPIPRGDYLIACTPLKATSVGPLALAITPVNHKAFGRSLFRIHGDNSKGDKSASHGCIILSRTIRTSIIKAGITKLRVV